MEDVLKFEIKDDILHIDLNGDMSTCDYENQKTSIYTAIQQNHPKKIILNANGLKVWNSNLAAFIFEFENRARGQNIPIEHIGFPQGLESILKLASAVDRKPADPTVNNGKFLDIVGAWGVGVGNGVIKGCKFLMEVFAAFGRLLAGKSRMRGTDLSFALEDCSYRALPIISLISFMVGLILAFVGAIQLKTFGAQIYVASLVTIGMTRIMGAIMTGIIMAGRTGASYAATIGTMQVNEEVDALKTMGISPIDFLVTPRMIALTVTMPILTMWADFMGMLGGGFVGITMLGIPVQKYWEMSLNAISVNNFLVGLFHGLVFGVVTAVCGCYYGIYCGRNADSVGAATTKAVVSAIVWMIVMTGIITVCCEVLEI